MIYCIGDSFTFGAELPGAVEITKTSSEFAWPNLLAQQLNHPVTNLGMGGCGNTRIVKRIFDCVLAVDKSPLIIAWTSPFRIELTDKEGLFDAWPGRNTERMCNVRSPIVKELDKLYNRNTDYWAYKNWLRQIILVQSFLKQYNHPYIMLQSHVTQDLNRQFKDRDQLLKSQIDLTKFIGWPYEGMTEWTYGCPKGPMGHPMELGHQKIAEKINEHIRHLGWVS